MTEFWENAFRQKQEMWGSGSTNAASVTAELFFQKGFKKILIPGVGYGRNAQPFIDRGMEVTGIEISETAIELAERTHGKSLKIHHGPVADMPFDDQLFDGIFCHALIHLLGQDERARLIADCYRQLKANGIMVFTSITKAAQTYGKGKLIGKDRYAQFGGVTMFFYDELSLQEEFSSYGLYQVNEITENFPFYEIQCRK